VNIENLDENIVDEFYINIGKNVKRLREKKGLTQLQLSQALGFKSVGLVSQSELYLKKQHFNLKHLYLISLVLEFDMNEFFKTLD
jgi:transcriptional regulator with XRE-family HTH domain